MGREWSGIATRVSLASLSLMLSRNGLVHEIPSTELGRIEKRGKSRWKSALMSAGTGAGMGAGGFATLTSLAYLAACSSEEYSPCRASDAIGWALISGGFGGILGAVGGAAVGAVRQGDDWRTGVFRTDDGSARGPVTAFAQLWTRVKTGDVVYVTGPDGAESIGVFQQVSDGSITLAAYGQLREMREVEVLRIATRGDSLWNGALIGAAIGASMGFGDALCDPRYPCGAEHVVGGISGAVVFGLFGASIDGLIKGRTTVYTRDGGRSVRVAPLIAPHRSGVSVSVAF